jgi:hypothetical protein
MFAMPWMASAAWSRGTVRRAGPLAVALTAAGVLAAGCSGGSGGSAGPVVAAASSAPASASPTASGEAQALEYAACMRTRGVPAFPDPTVANGSVGFSITAGDGVDPNSPQYQSARQACSSLRGGGTANSESGNLAKGLKFSQCMRSHGVPGFPDPNKNGGYSGTSSINPSSPTFQNAQSTCRQLSGLGGPGSSGSSS